MWDTYAWARTLPELEEEQMWCSQERITEDMIVERFGVPNWQMDGVAEGKMLDALGSSEQAETMTDNDRKWRLYLFQKVAGLYGILGFELSHDGLVKDVTCSFSEDNRRTINAFRKQVYTSGKGRESK
jgi:DUF2075 family protein